MAAITICSDFGAQINKVSYCFNSFLIYLPWSDGTGCHDLSLSYFILVFWLLSFKPTFSLSSFTFNKRLFSFSLLSAIRVVSSAYLRLLIFLLAILISACASSSPAFSLWISWPWLHQDQLHNLLGPRKMNRLGLLFKNYLRIIDATRITLHQAWDPFDLGSCIVTQVTCQWN